ncbi:hypothetical protein V2J09_021287 [Rumex salicifolius]
MASGGFGFGSNPLFSSINSGPYSSSSKPQPSPLFSSSAAFICSSAKFASCSAVSTTGCVVARRLVVAEA